MGCERPFWDRRWLDLLGEACARLNTGTPRFEDLYLERRLELRVTTVGTTPQVEECRTEGAAVRWRFPSRTVLHGRTGLGHPALDDLLAVHARRSVLPRTRQAPPPQIDPPRGWREWACDAVTRVDQTSTSIRFLSRRAVVIRPDGWRSITTPDLVRIEVDGNSPAALLGVWNHPQLPEWLGRLYEGPPSRAWRPTSGLRVPILFTDGTAGVLFHEVIGHLVEADLVASGSSPLTTLWGSNITASSLQVVDDPGRLDLPGGFSCDDEGVPARPHVVVRDGRLLGWLCDRAGSETLNQTPGRGRRASWARPPIARLSNLVVAAGNADPESLQNDLSRGLVITRIAGATVDPLASRIVLRVERGWEVRHGRRRRPLAPFELTGGVLDVVAHVQPEVGSDPTPDWRLGWCVKDGLPLPTGSEAPSLVVHHLEVL
jgi:hypothetical protein